MKNLIIGGLVGAIILFVWQFVSWSFTGIHTSEIQYTPNQDEILAALDGKLDDGTYFLPTVPPGTPREEHEAAMQEAVGKPWAVINYHEELAPSMTMSMIRGFVANFLAAVLLCWILMKFETVDLKTGVLTALAAGFIGYLTISYINSAWFDTSTMPQLIDTIVQWTLCGAWLGYYLQGKE